MTASTLMHRVLVCALAAWMVLCCCEKRILAASLAPTDAPTQSRERSCCISNNCCESSTQDASTTSDDCGGSGERSNHDRSCAGGCCNKAAFTIPPFELTVDCIGTVLIAPLNLEPVTTSFTAAEIRVNASDGEPPPRLALLISARLRI